MSVCWYDRLPYNHSKTIIIVSFSKVIIFILDHWIMYSKSFHRFNDQLTHRGIRVTVPCATNIARVRMFLRLFLFLNLVFYILGASAINLLFSLCLRNMRWLSLAIYRLIHFTVVCSLTWPLNGSEAGGDLVLMQTSLLLLCTSSCSYAN